MTRWLHLVRDGRDEWVEGLVRHQAAAGPLPTVVLLHQAARFPLPVPAGVPVLRLRRARDGAGGPGEVDETGLVRLMEEHDRVAAW